MKPFLLFLALLGFSLGLQAQEDEGPNSQKRFEGTIGKDLGIILLLSTTQADDGAIQYECRYHYLKTGVPISLSQAAEKDGLIVLRENEYSDAEGRETFTGEWAVEMVENKIKGTWSSRDGKKKLPINLTESYGSGSARVLTTSVHSTSILEVNGEKNGGETKINYLQLALKSKGALAINQVLRQDAWNIGGTTEEEGEEIPENPSAKDIVEAVFSSTEIEEDEGEESEDAEPMFNSVQDSQSVWMNESGFLTIAYLTWNYHGGAHGESTRAFRSFDLTSGEELAFEDLVKEGYKARWSELGAAELRLQQGAKPDAPLTELGLNEDKLELNETWFLTPGGIGFSYDPYEIASYARGHIQFVLPWKDIFQDLKPGTKVYELAEKLAPKAKK